VAQPLQGPSNKTDANVNRLCPGMTVETKKTFKQFPKRKQ